MVMKYLKLYCAVFCQKCVPSCTRDSADVLQCGGAPHSPATHGWGVAPAAGVEGGLAAIATRRVEARVEEGVGERARSWTQVAPIDIVSRFG
jgi:hypothetical protein